MTPSEERAIREMMGSIAAAFDLALEELNKSHREVCDAAMQRIEALSAELAALEPLRLAALARLAALEPLRVAALARGRDLIANEYWADRAKALDEAAIALARAEDRKGGVSVG